MSEINIPDQPDRIEDDTHDLPTPARAARRVRAYIAETGDGLYDVTNRRPLYARDLEAVARLVVGIDADRIAQAIGDPGSVVGRKLGPSWGEGNPGYAPEEETVTRWSTRAVLAALSGGA